MENGKKMYITAERQRKCLIYQRIMLTRFIRGLNKKLKAKGYGPIRPAEIIEEYGIAYRLAEDGCYYPDLRLPERIHYNKGLRHFIEQTSQGTGRQAVRDWAVHRKYHF